MKDKTVLVQDALRPEGGALDGYRLLVVQPAFIAASPICAALAAQGGEIVGPAANIEAALALAAREPIDLAVIDDMKGDDPRRLLALLAAEIVPVVIMAGDPRPPEAAWLHDLVGRALAALEGAG